jgi:hypothetical protein
MNHVEWWEYILAAPLVLIVVGMLIFTDAGKAVLALLAFLFLFIGGMGALGHIIQCIGVCK